MRFRQDKAALVGGTVIVVLVLLAIFGGPLAEHVTGHGQNEPFSNMTDDFGLPKGPDSSFWFGADRCTVPGRRCSSASSHRVSPC
jgi:hypothetical protein